MAESISSAREQATTNDILSRIAIMEARFGPLEQKTDRIESLLNQIVTNQSDSRESTDARTEKMIFDKIEPLKEGYRTDRTKIDGLESGKRYNIVTMAVIGAFLFSVFTYFSSQEVESSKQLVQSQANVLKNEFVSALGAAKSEVEAKVNTNSSDIAAIQSNVNRHNTDDLDFQNFKGNVTSQNAISITDRADIHRDLAAFKDTLSTESKELSNLSARVEQKFAEVETQFNAEGQIHNVQMSDQQRTNSMMFDSLSVLGAKLPPYPGAPFYHPNISQQAGNPNNDGR